MPNKHTLLDFICKANLVHSNKYGYSKSVYKGNKIKIEIMCKRHGSFYQNPDSHLRGHGCQLCSNNKKMMISDFIEKSNMVHNNKYDYSKTLIKNSTDKIIIICKIHGEFLQRIHNHLNGFGCSKCSNTHKLTNEIFIEKANLVFNNKYDYSLVNYKNMNKKVKIICSTHGEFEQIPKSHLKGNGCQKCSLLKSKSNIFEFINKANIAHNNKYDYNLSEYKGSESKIDIICFKHGKFKQTPHSHLSGSGCPKCNSSKGELLIEKILKENNINYKSQYTFDDLKYKGLLRFDFGITDENGNLKYLIEYNGKQHYEPNYYMFKTIKDYEMACFKDKLKKEYCLKNSIPLVIIKYDEDIEMKINKIINE